MKKKQIYYGKLLSLFLLGAGSVFRLHAQEQILNEISRDFTQYSILHYQEKIYLHIDKNDFLTGEIIWFRIYAVDAALHHPSQVSKVCNVELLDKDRKPVQQARIDLRDGSGSGSFALSSGLPPGPYLIRAYTAWMENASADFYFEQPIRIFNPMQALPMPDSIVKRGYDIQFFPEGGRLVAGIESRLGYKITDQYGHGLPGEAFIVDEKKDTILRASTQFAGMGSFTFLPLAGNNYHAVIKLADTVILTALPGIGDYGYVMNLDADSNQVHITVREKMLQPSQAVYLLIHSGQVLNKALFAPVDAQGLASFTINKTQFAEGISVITVFDVNKNPVCERLYFKRPRHKLAISVKTDKAIYSTKSPIDLSLTTQNDAFQPVAASASVSVFQIDSLQPVPEEDIFSYLLLQSDLKGRIENPYYYLNDSSAGATAAADNLMLTQGWRRFDWNDWNPVTAGNPVYLPEMEGPVLYGKLLDKKTGNPGRNILVYITIPGSRFLTMAVTSNDKGEILINLDKGYGNSEVIAQTDSRTADTNYRIEILPVFSDKYSSSAFPAFEGRSESRAQLLVKAINVQADNSYLVERKRHVFSPAYDTTAFYGIADKVYDLDDFTRFHTMEEVIQEFIFEMKFKKVKDKYVFRIKNSLLGIYFDDDPLILLDGLPVFDATKMMNFDPLKIKKIEVVPGKYFLGTLISDGLVSFKTYEGDLANYELDPNAIVLPYAGLQKSREFYTPVYDTEAQRKSRIPDFRNVLYWSPVINTGRKEGEHLRIYSSELKGRFLVLAQGITAEGNAGSTLTEFRVAGNP